MNAPTFETINGELLDRIPQDQLKRVLDSYYCDIEPQFLGFVDIYWHLAAIIPKHWTIVDLGCAYAAQAWLFAEHKAYCGVDNGLGERFAAPNTSHYNMPIAKFLADHGSSFNKKETFAICSYCPMWGERSTKPLRECFENLFVYYPHGNDHMKVLAQRIGSKS